MRRALRVCLPIVLSAACLAAAAPAQGAIPLIVTSAGDWSPAVSDVTKCIEASGPCTLRAAVTAANQLQNNPQITFSPALNGATIRLSAGSLPVTQSMAIVGPGAAQLTIDGSLGVDNGIIAHSAPALAVSGVTLQNGTSSDGWFNQHGGGAIQQTAGTLTVTGVTFTGNTSGSGNDGGAIYAAGTATTISGSTFTHNIAAGGIESTDGGAIYLDSGTLSVSASTFSGNHSADDGGAIAADGGPVTIDGSTFTANSAAYNGGAITVESGNLTLTSSNLTANTAQNGTAVAFRTTSATATISGSHVMGNTATGEGAAISVLGTLDLSNTLVENNTGAAKGGVAAATGHLTNVTITGNSFTDGSFACGQAQGCAGGVILGSGSISASTITDNTSTSGVSTANCWFPRPSAVTLGAGNTLAADCTTPSR